MPNTSENGPIRTAQTGENKRKADAKLPDIWKNSPVPFPTEESILDNGWIRGIPQPQRRGNPEFPWSFMNIQVRQRILMFISFYFVVCVCVRFFYNHKRQPSWQMATLDMKVHLQLRHSCTDRWMRTKVGHIFKVKLAINSIAAL